MAQATGAPRESPASRCRCIGPVEGTIDIDLDRVTSVTSTTAPSCVGSSRLFTEDRSRLWRGRRLRRALEVGRIVGRGLGASVTSATARTCGDGSAAAGDAHAVRPTNSAAERSAALVGGPHPPQRAAVQTGGSSWTDVEPGSESKIAHLEARLIKNQPVHNCFAGDARERSRTLHMALTSSPGSLLPSCRLRLRRHRAAGALAADGCLVRPLSFAIMRRCVAIVT